MGQAKTLDIRQQIVHLNASGQSNSQIASTLQVSLGTVKNILKRYRLHGDAGLPPSHANCGQGVNWASELAFRLVRLLRHLHPGWGVPYILLMIAEKFPDLPLQSIRQYQRRLFEHSGRLPAPILPPAPVPERSRIAHDTWEIDAKERLKLGDGTPACYLTVVDDGTGSLLAARGFPPRADQSSAG